MRWPAASAAWPSPRPKAIGRSFIWSATDAKGAAVGLWPKVVLPMFTSPFIGLVGGFLFMWLLMLILRKATPRFVNLIIGKAQLLSAGFMGYGHGRDDAQLTMGIIALARFTGTSQGVFNDLPDINHGRGCHEALERSEMGSRPTPPLGLGPHTAGHRASWLRHRAGLRRARLGNVSCDFAGGRASSR